ncbi:LysE type translocator family protein [Acinetobacter baumannii]|nr:LysE type translocator family protein [Acinetobacter baumannii]
MNYFDYFLFIFSVIIMIATPGPVMILVASAGLKDYDLWFKAYAK